MMRTKTLSLIWNALFMIIDSPETPPVTKLFLDKKRLNEKVEIIIPKKNVSYCLIVVFTYSLPFFKSDSSNSLISPFRILSTLLVSYPLLVSFINLYGSKT